MSATSARPTENPAWQGLTFRPLRESDLPEAWAFSQQVRWPHRLEDWQLAHALGQGSAICAGEHLVGVAIYWDYQTCATIGGIIVADSHRQRGLASRLVADALAAAAPPTMLLHATPAGAGVYRRLGFVPVGQLCQQQGLAQPLPAPLPEGARLRPASAADLDTLCALDTAASAMSRRALLAALLARGQGVVLEENVQATGFSLCHPFGRGEVIGPVVAADAARARALIGHWLAARAGRFIRIDVPLDTDLSDWLAQAGLAVVDVCARMAHGPVPAPAGPARIWALASQSLF